MIIAENSLVVRPSFIANDNRAHKTLNTIKSKSPVAFWFGLIPILDLVIHHVSHFHQKANKAKPGPWFPTTIQEEHTNWDYILCHFFKIL